MGSRTECPRVKGGHAVGSSEQEVYESITKSVSDRILMSIAAANNLYVMTGDIGNSYLNANTQGKIYTHTGNAFELVG